MSENAMRTANAGDAALHRHAALSLNGDWLEQAGFPVGTQVRVSVSPGKLVIENLELAAPGTGLPSGQSCAGGEPGSPQG